MIDPDVAVPAQESERLRRLRELLVLDSEPEPVFDAIARLASEVCGTPVALISLVDEDRQWFKANVGLDGVTETPRDIAFCAHAILDDEVMEVPDTGHDARFFDNPLVTGPADVRFYAGAPLVMAGGERVGTLCVIDHEPRALDATQRRTLEALSAIAVQTLAMRRDLITRALEARTKYDEALEQSEALHRLLVDEQDEMVSLTDEEGRFVYANQAHARHLGKRPSEVIGLRLLDFVRPADRAAVADIFETVRRTGEPIRGDSRADSLDGQERWVSWSNTLQRRPDGRPMVRAVGRDVSERKRNEFALAAKSDELADLYDHAPCGYYSLDADARIVRANAAALKLFGASREELLGRASITEFIENEALFQQSFAALKAGGPPQTFEIDLFSRQGTPTRVVLSVSAVRDAEGRFVATRTVAQDIAELKALRDKVERLTQEQLAMLDIDLIGIIKFKDRRIEWINRGAAQLFGYREDELMGQPSRMLYVDDEAHRKVGEQARAAFEVGQVFRKQMRVSRRDGKELWVDVLSRSLQPGEVISMLVDITLQRQAEVARVRSVTLEAENRQLVESNRVKGVFLSNMSHELHTPLNAVLGYVHLLKAQSCDPSSPKFANYLNQIAISGQHLLGLIDSTLDLAKLESGRFEFSPEPVQLGTLLAEVAEIHAADMRRRSISVALDLDGSVDEVDVDRLRLAQVVSHFVSNAVKFSRDGGQITLRASAEGDADFRITVVDTGIGVAEQDIGRLFTAFQQLSEGNRKAFPGAGLGLALARRLVEAQGGSVGVRSTPGVGSAFHLILPRSPVGQTGPLHPQPGGQPASTAMAVATSVG